MDVNVKTKSRQSLHALLEYYVAAGVTDVLEDEPIDQFTRVREAQERRIQQALKKKTAVQSSQTQDLPSQQVRKTTPTFITPSSATQSVIDPNVTTNARTAAKEATSLDNLKQRLEAFDGCGLKRTAKSLVFGSGNPDANIMFIGEAPGRDEDIQGLPFVGRSGQLLTAMLQAIGLDRENDCYIANIVPWRPPGNRTPTPQETEICRPFIERQIELVKPRLVVPLGGASAKQLLSTSDGILKLRGKHKTYKTDVIEVDAIATLHPAYLLRQPGQKRLAWQDLLKIRSILAGAGS